MNEVIDEHPEWFDTEDFDMDNVVDNDTFYIPLVPGLPREKAKLAVMTIKRLPAMKRCQVFRDGDWIEVRK